jgi:SAM-dependent methyltransferase
MTPPPALRTPARRPDANERNKAAWDELYGSTARFIWGSQPVGFLADFIAKLPALGPADHVLDAAAGEGRNLALLSTLGGRLHACDSSANALQKIPGEIRARVEVATCDLKALPYASGFFRCVLLSDVIETLPDPEPALSEVARVLAPGGVLLCNIPGMEDGIAGDGMVPDGGLRFLYRGRYCYHFLDEKAGRALLKRHGLEVQWVRPCVWREKAHPKFRPTEHLHNSRIYLATRSTGKPRKR